MQNFSIRVGSTRWRLFICNYSPDPEDDLSWSNDRFGCEIRVDMLFSCLVYF